MKRSIILLAAIAIFLLAGGVAYNTLHRSDIRSSEKAEPKGGSAISTPQPIKHQAVERVVNTARISILEEVAAVPSSFEQFAPDQIVDESIRLVSPNTYLRKRLIQTGGKYPHQLVKETIRRNDSGKYALASQVCVVADQVVVKLATGVSEEALLLVIDQYGISIASKLALPGTYVLQLEAATLSAVENAVQVLSRETGTIIRTEPNNLYFPTNVPNDPEWPLWGMQKIQAPAAWEIQTGSNSVLVAVVDTGISASHPDLAGNMWVNTGETGTTNGVNRSDNGLDDDGNGYVDDWQGWDFYNDDNDPDDDYGHGTHVAGTIGAVGDNTKGVVGVCWDISLVSMKIFGGDGGASSDEEIIDAILYASSIGAMVQNHSWGGYGSSQFVKEAIETINLNGDLFVAAAGNDNNNNDGNPGYPASYDVPNIISVAATDENDQLAAFSNYGATTVDLAAPGMNILSTIPGDAYGDKNGTSMAAPHVTGAIALLWSANSQLGHLDVKNALLNSADKLSSLNGKMVSGGRLNISTLMTAAADEDADGMPDVWELEHFGTTTGGDPDADVDSDHLTNLDEYLNGTDPNNSDTDGDSLVDGWEVTYGFSPLTEAGQLDSVDRVGISTDDEAMDVVVVDGYAYIADGDAGLVIIDVSDPANPVRAGSLDTDGFARGVAVSNGFAYVADGTNGLVVVDVSVSGNPQQLAVCEFSGTAARVVVNSSYAFVAGWDDYGDGLLDIVDISTPSEPSVVGIYSADKWIYDVYVHGNSAYIVSGNNRIERLDVSNPSNPTLADGESIGTLKTPGVYSINGDGAYIVVGSADQAVSIFDLQLNWVSDNPGIETKDMPADAYIAGDYVYVAEGEQGLEIFDISDMNNPVQIVHYPTYGGGNAVFAEGDIVYLADGTSGLQIFGVAFDSDADGMLDSWEIENFGDFSQSPTNDYDGDGISNWGEYLADLVPTNANQDADGLIDGFDEVQTYNTDPRTPDTDNDGISDYDEIFGTFGYVTDPLNPDTDGDGMTDGWEVDNGLNPLLDDVANDDDNDGLTNGEEFEVGTDPQDSDTDDDGMPDGWEVDNNLNPLVDDSLSDPDTDGLFNLYEYSLISNSLWSAVYTNVVGAPDSFWFGIPGFTDPNNADSDNDGLTDLFEITIGGTNNLYITNPNNADTDGDGLPDGWELDQIPVSDPTVPALGTDDSDGDGLTNDEEEDLGTDRANNLDPIFVDDDNSPNDPWPNTTYISDPDEDGTWSTNVLERHPFDAIQEGVDAAADGATVLVLPGEYRGTGNYDIDPRGKEITIRSWNDRDGTTIDTSGRGSTFLITSGETTNTVIKGFSLTTTCSDDDCDQQKGIVISASSPVVQDCRIYECKLAAIVCVSNATPRIENCEIEQTKWGIQADNSTPIIISNLIHTIGNGLAGDAGIGIYAFESSGLVVQDTVVSNCLGRGLEVVDDPLAEITGSIFSYNLGGVTLDNSGSLFENCEIRGNQAPTYYTDESGSWVVTHLVDYATEGLTDTASEDENGGGMLLLRGSSPLIRNCLIVENMTWADDPAPTYNDNNVLIQAYGLGGGLYIGTECNPTGVNCTVANNHANTRGGGLSNINGTPLLVNMIFWGNTANDAIIEDDVRTDRYQHPNIHCFIGNIAIDFSDIQYGYSGELNVTGDPLFIGSGDYHLSSVSSAAYSHGIPIIGLAPETDLDGNSRSLSLLPIDMGCYEYIDSDGDGMTDSWEIENGFDYLDPSDAALDADNDGATNLQEHLIGTDPNDPDTDGDGLNDGDELSEGTDPHNPDSDGDGFNDGDEVAAGTDPLNTDSDNDGMPDGWEFSMGLDPLFYNPNEDPDEDAASNLTEYENDTDPNNPDTDGDGMKDGWEIEHGLNPNLDDSLVDSDEDGLTNLQEYNRGTDPQNPDTDEDGTPDGDDDFPLDPDTDGDGMPNRWEIDNGLDPQSNDSDDDEDFDGLTNLQEYENDTDPNVEDTDEDGMWDGWEVLYGLDPLLDDFAVDSDDDGLTNIEEYDAGTNPSSSDTDTDGMPDPWELTEGFDPLFNDASADADRDGLTNLQEYQNSTYPKNSDTDDDGMPDGWEVDNGLNPLINDASGDPDNDQASNLFEYRKGTDPQVYNAQYVDTDDDGMSDQWEQTYGLDWTLPDGMNGTNGAAGDPDGDLLLNLDEYLNGTNPMEVDTDLDGLTDYQEVIVFSTQPTNVFDPIFVDDDAPGDVLVGGGVDPDISDTNENGTITLPFDSIQEAIDSPNTEGGMTILVTNGLYEGTGNYDINPGGKELVIRAWEESETNTVIKTHGYGSAFIINNGESITMAIQGFVIETFGDLAPEEGIVVNASSPLIKNCIIRNCAMTAISCVNGASPDIIDCTFYDTFYGVYASDTSGLLIQGVTVSNTCRRGIVIINDNTAEVTWSTITDCAGGITLDNSDASVRQCIIRDNDAPNIYEIEQTQIYGTGLFDLDDSELKDISDLDENGAGILIINGSSPELKNCLIVGNMTWAEDPDYAGSYLTGPAYGLGGGIYVGTGCNPVGVNCTVANNHANTRGGGLSSAGRPLFRNMIFWGNTSSNATIIVGERIVTNDVAPNLYVEIEAVNMGKVINIWYSDIEFGHSNAVWSITNNPLFAGVDDYTLSAGSPCVNSGTYYLAPVLDLAANERPTQADYPGNRVDLGCYEYDHLGSVSNYIALGAEIVQAEVVADPLADTDGDGFTDSVELALGTDRYDTGDYFRIAHDQQWIDGAALLAWDSADGCFYTVQTTDSLLGEWSDVEGWVEVPGDGSPMVCEDTREGESRFYRVLVRTP